jgi:4-amino-4-deoxy-L-arabinose transferase-like glycosyltransferase
MQQRTTDMWRETREACALGAILVVSLALLLCPFAGHVDDVDAQVYEVVAANMARDGSWLDLRFLPSYWPQFREHLPFGFWPAALAIRFLRRGGGWIPYAGASLLTVLTVWWTGRRIGGSTAGLLSALILSVTEVFWQYGARVLLEPFLLFFATASAAVALADEPQLGSCAKAAAWSALAVLIKGPFGLVPLVGSIIGSAFAERSARRLAWGALAVLLAVIPVAAFLVLDNAHGGSWYRGYLVAQLTASARGSRQDGVFLWWFPVRVIVGRFWPALLGVFVAVVLLGRGRDDERRSLARLLISCAVMVFLLCLPARKWGNHTYVALPVFSVCAGLGLSRALELYGFVRPRLISAVLWIAAVTVTVASARGAGRLVLRSPCVVSTAFKEPLGILPAGAAVVILGSEGAFPVLCDLASETNLAPRVLTQWGPRSFVGVSALVVRAPTPAIPGFTAVAEAQGWVLMIAEPPRG